MASPAASCNALTVAALFHFVTASKKSGWKIGGESGKEGGKMSGEVSGEVETAFGHTVTTDTVKAVNTTVHTTLVAGHKAMWRIYQQTKEHSYSGFFTRTAQYSSLDEPEIVGKVTFKGAFIEFIPGVFHAVTVYDEDCASSEKIPKFKVPLPGPLPKPRR
jgi:hypothetical protein